MDCQAIEVSSTVASWDEALADCETQDGSLAIIRAETENTAVRDIM